MLIGLCGEIASGKSTASDYLTGVTHYSPPYNTEIKQDFIEYQLAKPLKDIAVILGFEPHQAFGTQVQKLEINEFWQISCRKFLQVFGSEVCRDYLPKALPEMNFNNSTIWIRLFENFYAKNADKNIVVSDVRFKDEAEMIKKLGGVVIKINRKNKSAASATGEYATHTSETELQQITPDYVVDNLGDKNMFYNEIDKVILKI